MADKSKEGMKLRRNKFICFRQFGPYQNNNITPNKVGQVLGTWSQGACYIIGSKVRVRYSELTLSKNQRLKEV